MGVSQSVKLRGNFQKLSSKNLRAHLLIPSWVQVFGLDLCPLPLAVIVQLQQTLSIAIRTRQNNNPKKKKFVLISSSSSSPPLWVQRIFL